MSQISVQGLWATTTFAGQDFYTYDTETEFERAIKTAE